VAWCWLHHATPAIVYYLDRLVEPKETMMTAFPSISAIMAARRRLIDEALERIREAAKSAK